jgi:hypothetical protein
VRLLTLGSADSRSDAHSYEVTRSVARADNEARNSGNCGAGERTPHVLKPIFVVAACIFALMVVVKDGRVLKTTGLTAKCSPVSAVVEGTIVEACKPGKLEGRPDLTKRDCITAGIAGKLEYWRCPAEIQATSAGR